MPQIGSLTEDEVVVAEVLMMVVLSVRGMTEESPDRPDLGATRWRHQRFSLKHANPHRAQFSPAAADAVAQDVRGETFIMRRMPHGLHFRPIGEPSLPPSIKRGFALS